MSEKEEVEKAISDGIAVALKDEMVTRWVVLAETIGDDGVRGIWTFCQEGMKTYETLRFLNYAIQSEQAKLVIERLGESNGG